MALLGIGCDIVFIPRIKALIEKYNTKFLHRICTLQEISLAPQSNKSMMFAYFAKRFAAKEAFFKAASQSAYHDPLSFQDIEISNNKYGTPFFSKSPIKLISHLSLSDEKEYAIAYVTISI